MLTFRIDVRTALVTLLFLSVGLPAYAEDHLASWNDVDSCNAIIDFVERTTTPGSDDYVPASERIAVFDNDGTLWADQPRSNTTQSPSRRSRVKGPS